MAWYPKKFHPQRHPNPNPNPDSTLLEQIPPVGSVQESQMRRMVHFDIDPKNSMFVALDILVCAC